MGRGRRLLVAMLSAVALTTASAAPMTVFALGDVQVTLSCSDGTETNLTVDAGTLLDLKDAVEAMTLYPAGLSCTVTELPLGASLVPVVRAASGPQSYVVGGGQWSFCPGNLINVAVNARVRADDTLEGTINQTIPPAHAGCLQQSQLRTTVDNETCVEISNNVATVTSRVTKSDGFPYGVFFPFGSHLQSRFVDGNVVFAGADTREGNAAGDVSQCGTTYDGPHVLLRGNFLVRDNT
jgi:hypothetical protein